MAAGERQRRRHVAKCECANAPFGLRRLARIVDNEWVNDGQRSKHRLRRALLHERQRFARQPFKRAMGAAMDHRIDLFTFAEPDVEGDVGMAWRQACIMILRLAICGAAAIRLQGDEQIAARTTRNANTPSRASAFGGPQCVRIEQTKFCGMASSAAA